MAGGLQARQYLKFSLVTCFLLTGPLAKLVDALMHQNLWKLAIVRPLTLGLFFLSFHRLRFSVCSVATPVGARDVVDGPRSKKSVLRELLETTTTTRNKPLMISEDCHLKFKTTMFSNRSDALG